MNVAEKTAVSIICAVPPVLSMFHHEDHPPAQHHYMLDQNVVLSRRTTQRHRVMQWDRNLSYNSKNCSQIEGTLF